MRTFVVAVACGLVLGGCAQQGADPHAWGTKYDYGTPGAVAATYSGVAYYPACGNEVLTFEGHKWYPYKPANAKDLPADPLAEVASPSPAASVALVTGPVGAVVAPGPGDDVGTLVVYKRDLAYWESDSGTLSTWLTARKIEYSWVC
ncbi:MAG: hypothetical protein HGA51_04650 [Demequinaceae bacterium]|nr:hypothetical protein [Demequinaceae bacterium]